jgi:hypothetical protein
LGAIKPLDDWLTNLGVKSDIRPNLLAGMEINSQIWSVPMQTSNIGFLIDLSFSKQQELRNHQRLGKN